MKNIKIIIILNCILSIITIIYSYIISDKIPNIIPVHFNLLGIPDLYSTSSNITLYTIPLLITLTTFIMIFIYYHPEFSSMPFSMFLLLLPDEIQKEANMIIRRYMVKIITVLNLIFVFLYFSIISVWLNITDKINIYVLISLIISLITLIIIFVQQIKIFVYHYNTRDIYHRDHRKHHDFLKDRNLK